ncbi:MAG: universal stress protein [Solirubrobacteraceae bacterium]
MSLTTIVSYDGTPNDEDAITLARVLGYAGARLVLAYVRHAAGGCDQRQAQELLARGAATLADAYVETRVLVNGSTSEGLRDLAVTEGADLIVFGSDYRTPAGRIAPQMSTQKLMQGGPAAIAIAPADYLERPVQTIGLLAGLDDAATIDTAHAFANHFGATVTDRSYGIDLLIVGSRPEAQPGQTLLSAHAENAIVGTTAPVLVVGRGVAVDFESEIYVA